MKAKRVYYKKQRYAGVACFLLAHAGSWLITGSNTELSAHLPAPCCAVRDIAIQPARPCASGKWAHGHPRPTPARSLDLPVPGHRTSADGLGRTKVNVPVIRRVSVTVGRANVPRFVVPGTAADHPLATVWPAPRIKMIREKIFLRKPKVSAWHAWPIQLCTEGSKSCQCSKPIA